MHLFVLTTYQSKNICFIKYTATIETLSKDADTDQPIGQKKVFINLEASLFADSNILCHSCVMIIG